MGAEQRREGDKIRVLSDEKNRIINLFEMSLPIPAPDISDYPARCLQINVDWYPIIAGWLSHLAEIYSWSDASDENYNAIQQVLKLLEGEHCMRFQLRQNPDNSCLIEQSIDGGLSWSDAFDLSLCSSIVDGSNPQTILNNFYTTTYNTYQNYVYQNYVSNYINSVTDIAPELGYGDADDEYRDDALCYALGKFVDSVCNQANEYFNSVNDTANDLRVALALAAAVVGIIALGASGVGTPAAVILAADATMWAAGIGLGSALGGVLFDHWSETNQSAYNDDQAKQDIVCCLYNNLAGIDFDQDDFIAAFNCTGLSTNATAIYDAAAILAQENATYASMVSNMSYGLAAAKAGLLPECLCQTWCYVLTGSDFVAVETNGYTLAVASGSDWTYSDWIDTSNRYRRSVQIELASPLNTTITSVEINYSLTKGNYQTPAIDVGIGFKLTSSGMWDEMLNQNDVVEGALQTQVFTNDYLVAGETFQVTCVSGSVVGSSSGWSGTVTIHSVKVYGIGSNPFGTDNC